MVEPGQQYGAWTVEAVIGEGGMATVVRAIESETGEVAALKILTSERRAEVPGLLDRLKREATVLQALSSIPSVVQYHDMFRVGEHGADVLVLEYIEGRPLSSLVGGPPLEVMQVLEWMGHACHAIHDLHAEGYVHRDLKPDNLMLVNDPEQPIRIIDLNSAGEVRNTVGQLTRVQGTFPFTPEYLAPECFDGVPADKSADVYALGMSFAELLLGHHPLDPESEPGQRTNSQWRRLHEETPFPDLREARSDIPEGLQEILEAATARLRRDRIPDAVVLWHRLKALWDELDATDVVEQPEDDAPPPPPTPSGSTGAGWMLGGVGLALGAMGTFGLALLVMVPMWLQSQAETQRAQERAAELERSLAEARERQAAEDQAAREEAEEASRIAAERAAKMAAEQAAAEAERKRLDALMPPGVTPVPAVIEDTTTLDKIRNARRWGSHWIYEEHGFGRMTLTEHDGVLYVQAENTGPGKLITLDGYVQKVDAKGVTIEGKLQIRYVDYQGEKDPVCGWTGNHRFNLGGHAWYLREQASCPGRHHYVDWFVDDAWLDAHPEHKP